MKKQIYKLSLIAFLGLGAMVSAQVGINEDAPKATLDVTAKTTSGDTAEGILVPRVSEVKAEAMGGNTVESTLIYIDEATDASTQNYTAEVDAKGFYYFADSKWNKVGSQAVKGGIIRKVVLFAGDYTLQPDDYFIVQTGAAGTLNLPSNPPVGREFCGINKGSGILSFEGGDAQGGNITLSPNISSCYIYDGTQWASTTGY